MKTCSPGTVMPRTAEACRPASPAIAAATASACVRPPNTDIDWFDDMVEHNYDYACAEKRNGRKLVGIMCEFTPREILLAAGAMPVCLCGGSAEMIPPAERELPANLCPLIKSTYGYSLQKANPFLEGASGFVGGFLID